VTATGKIQQTAFAEKIAALQKQLGIPENYGAVHQLELCEECAELVSIGKDIFDRDQKMTPQAAQAWFEMKDAAAAGGIELQAISAFRSVEYQAGIISRKLDAGQSMAQVLKVSAAPGYSEHHSGRALDISTPGFEPLKEAFENSPAFEWLQESAGDYGFALSFPRNNQHGLAYEPWHWCWIASYLFRS
jgi:D-alanyl-D-alanine carboxypeptidase